MGSLRFPQAATPWKKENEGQEAFLLFCRDPSSSSEGMIGHFGPSQPTPNTFSEGTWRIRLLKCIATRQLVWMTSSPGSERAGRTNKAGRTKTGLVREEPQTNEWTRTCSTSAPTSMTLKTSGDRDGEQRGGNLALDVVWDLVPLGDQVKKHRSYTGCWWIGGTLGCRVFLS